MAEPRGVPWAPRWSKLTARNPTGDANEVISAVNWINDKSLVYKKEVYYLSNDHKQQYNQEYTLAWLLWWKSREKETEAREKDAEPDKNKPEVNPPKYTTFPPILWRNVPIPTRETTKVTKINIKRYTIYTFNQYAKQLTQFI